MTRRAELAACALLLGACAEPGIPLQAPSDVQLPAPRQITVALDEVGCADSDLELAVPFYEGITLRSPKQALKEMGLERIELVYPAPLSIPAVAWRCRSGDWNVIGAALEDVPVAFELSRSAERSELRLTCLGSCRLQGWTAKGGIEALARSFRSVYAAKEPSRPPLSASIGEVRFFVHRWVSDDDPAERTDWSIDALRAEMRGMPDNALGFVYGWEPSSVDLGGRTFWSDGAEDKARSVIGENPKLSHLAWLNLRTYKHEIPRLGVSERPSAELVRGQWKGPKGPNVFQQYAYVATEMCLCSPAWQASRKLELERLANLGFKVIQLDEFPIATRWHAEPCRGEGHAHAPGDFAGEWRCTLGFVAELAKRADERGLSLTSEEPSAALLELTRGYIDRQPNGDSEIYAFWKRSRHATPVPLYSAAFGTLTTPYSDADPDAAVPPGWLTMRKVVSDRD